jgi:transposase-like protein
MRRANTARAGKTVGSTRYRCKKCRSEYSKAQMAALPKKPRRQGLCAVVVCVCGGKKFERFTHIAKMGWTRRGMHPSPISGGAS